MTQGRRILVVDDDASIRRSLAMLAEAGGLACTTYPDAESLLRDAALDELVHKHELEKALLEGSMGGSAELNRQVPTMNLDYVLAKKELTAESDGREALAYAIHLEKGSIDFYRRMSHGCSGAPMAPVFNRLLADETRHLQSLEDLYEQHFLPEG